MSPLCTDCGRSVAPDSDPVRVEVTHKRIRDRDDIEEYYLHDDCAVDAFDDWTNP